MQMMRDVDMANGYWGALAVLAPMKGNHCIIIDGPIGCHYVPVDSALNYTDSIPYLQNVHATHIIESDVALDGTLHKLQKLCGELIDRYDQLFILSCQESEIISSEASMLEAEINGKRIWYMATRSLDTDDYTARDEVLHYLYQKVRPTFPAQPKKATDKPLVNIIGPTFGNFNSYADFAEIKRLITGIGAEVNVAFPFDCHIGDMVRLDDADANVLMYQEYGQKLANAMGKPAFQAPIGLRATEKFLLELSQALGLEESARAFIAQEKATTLQGFWDVWRSPHQDIFRTSSFGVYAHKTYAEGLTAFFKDELGFTCDMSGVKTDRWRTKNAMDIKASLLETPPTLFFGCINEKIYITENSLSTRFIPCAHPMPIVCRSTGTPYMGFAGAVYLIQIVSNELFDILYSHIHIEYSSDKAKRRSERDKARVEWEQQLLGQAVAREVRWSDEALKHMDVVLKKIPFFVRVSASKMLKVESEKLVKEQYRDTVTPDDIDVIFARFKR
ncbi:nitrogenase component 1 [Heliophilum fasciatum]|uniref:Chlorophyllide a reductase subunit Z n=1 Tax=Heliophilum fasciatum TaxID=35700 RepID=A0A4R2RVD6_9FIRM|nr:nitrogenase component 1 [Heliophilum fasciatum]MCW2277094.1 chlorophyllide a reductase subunit Z [Heliophilum fasciatum]TCP68380.1 chlorophyllide a reductase subunit Z [Heliophilum fasciatum]